MHVAPGRVKKAKICLTPKHCLQRSIKLRCVGSFPLRSSEENTCVRLSPVDFGFTEKVARDFRTIHRKTKVKGN